MSGSVSVPLVPSERQSLERTPVDRKQRERRRSRLKLIRHAMWALLLVGAGLFTVLSLRPQPVPVDVADVELGPLSVVIEESGRTRVKDRYTVSAVTTGRLSRVWLEPGDNVRAGDKLAEISPALAPLIDARSRAQAEARVGAASSSVGQARTRLNRADVERERVESELSRTRKLAVVAAATAQELEAAQFVLRMALAEVTSAEFAVKVAEEEARMARSALGGEEGGAPTRGHLDILAPTSGRVLRLMQESAGVVQAGTPLMELGDPAALEGVVDLLTTDAVHVRAGTPAAIVDWGGEREIDAKVASIEPSGFTRLSALGVEEQRVNVILDFTGPSESWAALGDGYHIQARIVLWRGDQIVKVPLLAVFRHGVGMALFKIEENRARLVPVTLGHRGALEVEVMSGVMPGDIVIVHPGDRVKDGVAVRAQR